MHICKICNQPMVDYNHLRIHKIDSKTYFDLYFKTLENSTCKICKKQTKWNNTKKCYCTYCSTKCRNLDPGWQEKRNNKMISTYGKLTTANKDKYSKTCENKTFLKYKKQYTDGVLRSYDIKTKYIHAHCNICNNDFSCLLSTFTHRLNYLHIPACTFCKKQRSHSGKSLQENEVFKFIKTIYMGNVLTHDRKILHGLELDFYFPELNIAIEYDGTYHHADKRFYSPHDIIKLKHCTAQDIWLKDVHKNQYCDILGIKLLRIAEYDWENNTDVIKNQIKLFLGLM